MNVEEVKHDQYYRYVLEGNFQDHNTTEIFHHLNDVLNGIPHKLRVVDTGGFMIRTTEAINKDVIGLKGLEYYLIERPDHDEMRLCELTVFCAKTITLRDVIEAGILGAYHLRKWKPNSKTKEPNNGWSISFYDEHCTARAWRGGPYLIAGETCDPRVSTPFHLRRAPKTDQEKYWTQRRGEFNELIKLKKTVYWKMMDAVHAIVNEKLPKNFQHTENVEDRFKILEDRVRALESTQIPALRHAIDANSDAISAAHQKINRHDQLLEHMAAQSESLNSKMDKMMAMMSKGFEKYKRLNVHPIPSLQELDNKDQRDLLSSQTPTKTKRIDLNARRNSSSRNMEKRKSVELENDALIAQRFQEKVRSKRPARKERMAMDEEKRRPEDHYILILEPDGNYYRFDTAEGQTIQDVKRYLTKKWQCTGLLLCHGILLSDERSISTLNIGQEISFSPQVRGGSEQPTLHEFFPKKPWAPNNTDNREHELLTEEKSQVYANTGEVFQDGKEAGPNLKRHKPTTQISLEESILGKSRRKMKKPTKDTKKWKLHILQWNAYHLVTDGDFSGFNHKATELMKIVEEHEIDVILIQELKAKESKQPAPTLPGFHPPIELHTRGTKAIATYVRRHLFYEVLPAIEELPETIAFLSIRVPLKDKKHIRIDNVYIHPDAPKNHRVRAWNWTTNPDEEYHILAGDFNERSQILGNVDGDANPSFECLLEEGYGILNNGSATRAQKSGNTFCFSAIDGTLASPSLTARLRGWETLNALDSDHLPIVTKLRMSPKTKPRPKLKRIRYKQLHAEFLKYFEEAPGNVGEKFITAIKQLEILRFTKMPIRYKCTFWNNELELLKRKRNKARNRNKLKKYLQLRSKFRQAFKQAKTKDYLHRLKQTASLPNPWKTMKLLVPSLRKPRNKITRSPADTQGIVESLVAQYAEIMTTELEERKEIENQGPTRKITVHPWEIQTVLRSSNHSSSPGHDGLTYRHIFKLCENLAILTALTAAVNHWVQHGIPDSFKLAKIIPIPKPGKNSGFRPISLLSCLSKVVERIMTIRMRRRYDHLIPENQAGCRSGSAAPDCIIRLFHASTRAQEKMIQNGRGHFAALFIDFSKAYDRVEPEILLQKLESMGISQVYRHFIKDWLTDRKIQVHMHDCSSQVMTISRGLPQGSSLSVLLWQLYIADIPLSTRNSAQYMDDSCAWRTADTKKELANSLQNDLDKIKTWAEKSMILLNTKKTCIVMNEHDPAFSLKFRDAKILPVRNARYLGFDLVSFQEPNGQIMIDNSKVADAIKKRTHLLYHLKNKVAPSVLNQVGQALIMGKLQYYAPAWGAESPSFIKPLQVAVNRLLRIICTGRRTTPIPLLISRTGILPVELIIKKSAARTYGRMMEYPQRSLFKTYSEWDGNNSNSTPLGALYDFGYLMEKKYRQYRASQSGRISFVQMESLAQICFDIPETITQALSRQGIRGDNLVEEIQIWSDGSLAESFGEKSAGAGWVIVTGDQFTRNHRKVEPAMSSFHTELAAMTLGLEELIQNIGDEVNGKRVGIFSDSQSLCKHLEKIANNDGIIQSSTRSLINKLASLVSLGPRSVTIHWIPGHQGYKFNELADKEANHGRQSNHIYRMKIPRSLLNREADRFIDTKFKKYLRENIHESKWNKDYPSRDHFIKHPGRQLPKKLHQIRLFNLQTGHTGLRAHHQRIAKNDFDDKCRLCKMHPETIEHVFAECSELPELISQRRRLIDIFGDESITKIIGRNDEKANEVLTTMIRKLIARRIWI